MIARDDFVNFEFRGVMKIAISRLLVDETDRLVRSPYIEGPEIHLHGVERDENSQIQGVVIPVADSLQRPDNLEPHAVQQDRAPD